MEARDGHALDALADELFWADRPDASTARRREAHAAHAAAGDAEAAARSAWRVFYDHWLVGEAAVASGWRERARTCAAQAPGGRAGAWVAVADADVALASGASGDALVLADVALVGAGAGDGAAADADLAAMARQVGGRALLALGRVRDGMARLDEAMVAVVEGELDPTFTGWVFCTVLGACHEQADLRRAAEWTDQATRWCDGRAGGLLYRGLCRLHAVELQCLRGAWVDAAAGARRACEELAAHDPRYAGEAVYLAGEVARLTGDVDGADAWFDRAEELGRDPEPGRALVLLARGRAERAARLLRATPAGSSPWARVQLLAAVGPVAHATGDVAWARVAADELAAVAATSGSELVAALAALADGGALLVAGNPEPAAVRLRTAWTTCTRLGLPHDAARAREWRAEACALVGDGDTAAAERAGALAAYGQLGARSDVARLEAAGRSAAPGAALTDRQVEVLRLVARGATNREVGAALFVSEHTVARHLANVFARTGTSSRAAATAWAYEHGLVGDAARGPS